MLEDYIINKPVLKTNRLIIRPLTKEDTDDLLEWTADRSVYTYWGKGPGVTDKNPSLMFSKKEKPSKSFHLGIEYKKDGKIVGDIWVYLIENDRMAKTAFRISPHYQKKGIATEALGAVVKFCFENTELKRLWTDVDIRNYGSIKVLENCHFKREGMIRQGKMVSSWCDYYLYGLLKEDLY